MADQRTVSRTCNLHGARIFGHTKLTYYNAYRQVTVMPCGSCTGHVTDSRAEVSADSANIETTLAIHKISEHVSAGHFDRAFIENIICHHIPRMAKIKASEKEKLKVSRLLCTSWTVEGVFPPCKLKMQWWRRGGSRYQKEATSVLLI